MSSSFWKSRQLSKKYNERKVNQIILDQHRIRSLRAVTEIDIIASVISFYHVLRNLIHNYFFGNLCSTIKKSRFPPAPEVIWSVRNERTTKPAPIKCSHTHPEPHHEGLHLFSRFIVHDATATMAHSRHC